jgi:hypothetical protein
MTGSRFAWRTIPVDRLRKFVAIDNLTAQVPLIDLTASHKRGRIVRIWTAYDVTRKFGTYTEVNVSGLVRTVTVYPSGRMVETINRPADKRRTNVVQSKGKAKGVSDEKGPATTKRDAGPIENVLKRAQLARAKEQGRADDNVAQKHNRSERTAKGVQESK